MLTRREDGCEIDTDPARLDLEQIHEWLSTDAYWARGRTADVTQRSIQGSVCFGAYAPDGTQIAFARAVTDLVTFAWICDVYVAKLWRGQGVGSWLTRVVQHTLREAGVRRIVLATADAHEVYARTGFVPLRAPDRWMEIDERPGGIPVPPPRT